MLALALLIVVASADERRPTSVTFTAPAECPTVDRYRAELTFRSTRIELLEPERATATVTVTIIKRKRVFDGSVAVTTSTGKSVTKRVSGPRCESVTAALSLAAALVLDPEAKLVVPAAIPPTPAPEPIAPPVAIVAPEPEPPEPARIETPNVVAPAPVQAEPPRSNIHLAVFGLAELATTISGNVDPSFGVAASLAFPLNDTFSLGARIGGTGGLGRAITNGAGTVGYATHFSGALEAGLAARFGIIRPELTVATRFVFTTLEGRGADEVRQSTRTLAELGPRARVSLILEAWEVALAGTVGASLTRERYLFQPDGIVFSVPAWAVSGQLSVGRSLL